MALHDETDDDPGVRYIIKAGIALLIAAACFGAFLCAVCPFWKGGI